MRQKRFDIRLLFIFLISFRYHLVPRGHVLPHDHDHSIISFVLVPYSDFIAEKFWGLVFSLKRQVDLRPFLLFL